MDERWDQGWETRPLERGPSLTLPTCSLTTPDGHHHVYNHQPVTLGSAPDNDLVLAHETVSRYHAAIVRTPDSYLLRDLDSTNGTCVEGVRIKEAYLVPGARLRVGDLELGFGASHSPVANEPGDAESMGRLVGRSDAMRRLFAVLEQVAPTDVPVLITGETGTGKEVVARTIHDRSRRSANPFVVVDCSAIPANLMEAELFGHERGSFSGAVQSREGLFELAHGGTLFLDEVGELPLELQPKLLRALETGTIRRVGGRREQAIDFRLLAATHRKLSTMVADGEFRADLYYRLNVIPVTLPPLRERRDDLEPLLKSFLQARGLTSEAAEKALKRLLPKLATAELSGNVRELKNLLDRFLATDDTAMVFREEERPAERGATSREIPDFKQAKEAVVHDFERDYLAGLLAHTGGNVSAAARLAGLDRKHLRELLKRHELY